MNAREFEDAVWKIEGIRIVVRASGTEEIDDYDFKNAAPWNWTLTKLLNQRIDARVGEDTEVVVIRGDGELPRKNTTLDTIRTSYEKQ